MNVIIQAPDGSRHIVSAPDPQEPAAPAPDAEGPSALHTAGVAAAGIPRALASTAFDAVKDFPYIVNTDLIPGAKDAKDRISNFISNAGPTPKNKVEQYVQSGAEGAAMAPLSGVEGGIGSIIRALASSAMSGLGGQAGGDIGEALGYPKTGRMVGSVVAGQPVPIVKALLAPDNARKMVQKAVGNVPDTNFEFGQAQGNQAAAAAQGIPQLAPQAFENAPGLLQLQKAVVDSGSAPKSSAVLQKQVGEGLNKAQQAIGGLPGNVQSPLAVANATQGAATDAIKAGYEQAGNAFRTVLGNKVPPIADTKIAPFANWLQSFSKANPNSNIGKMADDVLYSIQNPEAAAAKVKPKAGAILGPNGQPLAQQIAASQPQFINDPLALKQSIDDSLSGFGPRRLNSDSVGANESRAMATIRNQFNAVLNNSPLKAANQAYEGVMDSVVNPLKASEVGQIAGRAGAQEGIPAPAKITSLLDKGTVPGATVSPILSTARVMNKQNPAAFSDAVKTNLATKLAQASTTTGGQLDAASLKAFHDSIYGNAAQKLGLRDQLVGVAEGQKMSSNALYPGFTNIMDTIGRLVNRPGNTAGVSSAMLGSMSTKSSLTTLAKLATFWRERTSAVEGAMGRRVASGFDDMFTSPEGVQMLRKLATTPADGTMGQAAISSYLAAKAGDQTQQNQK